jgi:thiol:disulfide interchange protein
MRLLASVPIVLLCLCALGQTTGTASSPSTPARYVPVYNFISKRDASADVQAAIAEAQRTGKRVIIDIGGDWCVYCQQMDKLFHEHPELAELRDKNFLTVAVYYGPENWNRQFLSHYPKLLGVPHVFVVETNGTILNSQRLVELRTGGQYDPEKMKTFLLKWALFVN